MQLLHSGLATSTQSCEASIVPMSARRSLEARRAEHFYGNKTWLVRGRKDAHLLHCGAGRADSLLLEVQVVRRTSDIGTMDESPRDDAAEPDDAAGAAEELARVDSGGLDNLDTAFLGAARLART